jgi:hypothetical protein
MDYKAEYDSILWNTLIKNISEKDYIKQYNYLFDKDERLSTKLKKYNFYNAQRDLQEEQLTQYHTFIAQARIAINKNITVYKLTDEIINTIQKTSIADTDEKMLVPLKNSFIIETHNNDSTLFGDIDAIIGYIGRIDTNDIRYTKNENVLIILFHVKSNEDINWYKTAIRINDVTRKQRVLFAYTGANLFTTIPPYLENYKWIYEKIDYKRNVFPEKKYCDICKYNEKCNEKKWSELVDNYKICYKGLLDNLLSYIYVFNYMLIADNSPIKEKRDVEHTSYTIKNKGIIIEKKQEWIIKYLYLDESKMYYENHGEHNELNKDNLINTDVNVKGYWRFQACGKGYKDRKLKYINPHTTTKWVKIGDKKIIVGVKKEPE